MISLQQAFNLFLFDRETYCKDKTITNYKNTIRYFIEYMTEQRKLSADEIDISTISLDDIKLYVCDLRNRKSSMNHPLRPTSEKNITKRTVRTYSIDIRSFFHFLYNQDYIKTDIMKNFKLIKEEKKMIEVLTNEEIKILDKTCDLKTKVGLRNWIMFHLMLDCGLRMGDVINLKVKDVNFTKNYIFVHDGKGDKDRVLPMCPILKKNMGIYHTLHHIDSNDNFLQQVLTNEPITEDTIKNYFARLRKRVGITRLKPHLFRHTFATSYIIYGGDLFTLRMYMGHSHCDTTENYLHIANTYRVLQTDVYRLDKTYFKRL